MSYLHNTKILEPELCHSVFPLQSCVDEQIIAIAPTFHGNCWHIMCTLILQAVQVITASQTQITMNYMCCIN